jgi:exonuclease VII small subunit
MNRPGFRVLVQPAVVLAALGVIGWRLATDSTDAAARTERPHGARSAAESERTGESTLRPPARLAPASVLVVDEGAVARARSELARLRSEHATTTGQIERGERELAAARSDWARAIKSSRTAGSRYEDAGPAIARATQARDEARAEVDKLRGELQALEEAPGPRRRPLIDRSPVAQAPEGTEYHFEVRQDRVAWIDLDRLIERVKADARIQVRLAGSEPVIGGEVGPAGDFAIRYELVRGGFDDVLDPRISSFNLRGWELVPVRPTRGESYEQAMGPASDFMRVVSRMDRARDAATLWVYPDGFALYRQLRDVLASSGVLVAARPLPEGIPIRGSPGGSLSAAQ